MVPTVRLPAGPVTPHGAFHILRDRIPQVALRSPDDSVVLHLMGGLAIPDRTMPERVELKDIKGLVPPWQIVDQKGATQDGVTFIDAMYDPIEAQIDVVCHGRNPRECRKVVNLLIGSLDAKQESELSWFTHEMGRWWAPIRWFKPPDHSFRQSNRQAMSLRVRADMGFWRSYPDVDQFRFDYAATGDDDFETDYADLNSSALWTVAYTGGTGLLYTEDGVVKSTLNGRTAVARRDSYTSATDDQVIELDIGAILQWFYPTNTAVDIWFRMANSGTPGADGCRLRIERHKLTVSSFNSGVETVLRERILIIPPLPGEKWTIVAGTPALLGLLPSDPRRIKVLRNSAPVMMFKESGTTAQIGSGFRSIGFGLHATGATVPPQIRGINAGGNTVETQSGFVRCINAGDQEMWKEFTCFGPFTKVKIWNGPNAGADEYVEFGPLGPTQVALIRSDPRKYGVKDLTSQPATAAEENAYANALTGFLSFVTLNNVTHVLDVFQSIFGLFGGGAAAVAPQGNLYSLLNGRFSEPIPPKSPGNPAEEYFIKVEIEGGNADSQIIASGIPLRRNPY
jgi:hypothetical protein